MDECQQQNAQSTDTECDYLKGWIINWSHRQNVKMVKPRDIAGNTEKEVRGAAHKTDSFVSKLNKPLFSILMTLSAYHVTFPFLF